MTMRPVDLHTLGVAGARQAVGQRTSLRGPLPSHGLREVRDVTLASDGDPLLARIYIPNAAGTKTKQLPLVIYFHGGGWMTGDLDSHDSICRSVARESGHVIASIDYPLAPESPFPIALNHCAAFVLSAASNWSGPGLTQPTSGLILMGDSSGGNLAASLALSVGAQASVLGQVLIYPALDGTCSTNSYRENGSGYGLSASTMRWFWDHYLPGGTDRTDPHASPVHAPDLSKAPPALIITAELDPLRDEGNTYAVLLREAGVAAACTQYSGALHGFMRDTNVPPAPDALSEVAEWICSIPQNFCSV